MVVIRLSRGGAKKHPFYHIVVSDSRRPRDSGYLERLGYFNPFAAKEEAPVFLNRDRFDYWISQGAKSSQRVSSIVSKLDKGEFTVKVKTETEIKKSDVDKAKAAKPTETKDEVSAEKGTADGENTTVAKVPQQTEESKAAASQTELALEDIPASKQEEKQLSPSAEVPTSDNEKESAGNEPPVEVSEASQTDKKAADK